MEQGIASTSDERGGGVAGNDACHGFAGRTSNFRAGSALCAALSDRRRLGADSAGRPTNGRGHYVGSGVFHLPAHRFGLTLSLVSTRADPLINGLREWADRYRGRGKFTPVGVTFHWFMAAAVLYQLVSGWAMQRYLAGPEKLEAYRLHSEIGMTLLLFGALRLLWRLMVPGPINDADNAGWRSKLAYATEGLFYALFVILPLSGWTLWSAIQPARPLSLLGLVTVPAMPFRDISPEWQYWLLYVSEIVHVGAVIILAPLVLLHTIAALKHHFWDRDDVLEGILPEVPDNQWHPGGPNYSRPGESSHPPS